MKIHATQAALLAVGGLLLSGNAAAQSYAPVGPQQNIPAATVTGGGWTECYRDNLASGGTPLATILAACTEENLMMSCAAVGDPNLRVLAWAPRVDVTTDTGTGNVTTLSNGSEWYYNGNYSWGFAPAGEAVTRSSCDTTNTGNNDRICYHTSGGNIDWGWRCGNVTGWSDPLNGYERIFYQSTPKVTLTVPGTNSPVLVAEELIIPPSRTITNTGALDIETAIEYAFSPGEVRYARLYCPGVRFAAGTTVTYGGDPSNLVGAVNTTPEGAIYFSITAGATPVVATDTLTIDGDRIIDVEGPIDCTYGLYDFPSQAQAGGSAGRVVQTRGAYIRFAPSYGLRVDMEGNPVADVESNDPAYSEFVNQAPTYDVLLGNVGGFSYGTAAQLGLSGQPITLDGAAVELTDLMGAATALVFTGDFEAASDVFFSPNANCSVNIQSADSFDDSEAVFEIGSNPAMNHYLCYEAGGVAIRATDVRVSLAPVSASAAVYAVGPRGPLDLGQITRNGTELQAPFVQVPATFTSRMVLTNTGSLDRPYEISVFGEAGNVISTNNLTGSVPAGGTIVVDLKDVLTGFTGDTRGTINVTVSGPNHQIQGLYQIVNPDSGTISNHVMVRPGTN